MAYADRQEALEHIRFLMADYLPTIEAGKSRAVTLAVIKWFAQHDSQEEMRLVDGKLVADFERCTLEVEALIEAILTAAEWKS